MNQIFSGFEKLILDEKFSEDEIIIIKWQYGYFGSFYKKIIEAYRCADAGNKAAIEKGFPELVRAMERFDKEEGFFEYVERKAETYELNPQR